VAIGRKTGLSRVAAVIFCVVFSGKRGELRQCYREGQEDQLGALGFVVNTIVLWNTIYMEAVLERFRKEEYPVNEVDKARLSPLIHEHIKPRGAIRSCARGGGQGETAPAAKPTDQPVLSYCCQRPMS
jgi:hypothetical protein